MLYLALVQRPPLKLPQLQLLAVERKYKLWQQLDSTETITIGLDATKLANNKLALAELTPTREVIKITDGAVALPQILHRLSVQVFKLLKLEKEIDDWKDSLQYQSAQLNDRACALDVREELVKVQEELYLKERNLSLTNELIEP